MSQVRPYTRHQLRRYVNSAAYVGAAGPGTAPTARALVGASSQYLSHATGFPAAYPFTVSLWFYDTGVAASGGLWSSANSGSNLNYWFLYVASGKVGIEARNTTSFSVETSTTYATKTWNLATGVFASATDRRVYLNGGGKASDTNSATPTPDRGAVGVNIRLAIDTFFTGYVADVAIWGVGLTDADVAAHHTLVELNGVLGYPPAILIRPDGVRDYWPLFGNASPELNQGGSGNSLTLVNTPTKAPTRPPVVFPPGLVWVTGS